MARRGWGLMRVLAMLAALGVLTMPVEYRGGAEHPHAHAIFQFWASGDDAAFAHHGHEHTVPAGGTGEAAARSAGARVDPPPDTPLLSDMTAPAERMGGLAIAVAGALLVLLTSLCGRVRCLEPSIPTGRGRGPEPPPPRQSLVLGI